MAIDTFESGACDGPVKTATPPLIQNNRPRAEAPRCPPHDRLSLSRILCLRWGWSACV
jgi:hypothetical protein